MNHLKRPNDNDDKKECYVCANAGIESVGTIPVCPQFDNLASNKPIWICRDCLEPCYTDKSLMNCGCRNCEEGLGSCTCEFCSN